MAKAIHILGTYPPAYKGGMRPYIQSNKITDSIHYTLLPTYGVNNIWDYVPATVVYAIDEPKLWPAEKLKVMLTMQPRMFYHSRSGWTKLKLQCSQMFLPLTDRRGQFDSKMLLPFGSISLFSLFFIAMRENFDLKTIIVSGVNLREDYNQSRTRERQNSLLSEFKELKKVLDKAGIEVIVNSKTSLLNEVF